MFAYCGNTPVLRIDPTGMFHFMYGVDDHSSILHPLHQYTGGGGGAIGGAVSSSGSGNRKPNLPSPTPGNPWNPFNTDEEAVIRARYFAFYKGVLVIKLPIGTDAFSFGIIFMGDEIGSRSDPVETVRHEYGHCVHLSQIGARKYLTSVMVPSLIGYWADVETIDYYSQPYEYIADRFGNVERFYNGKPYPYSSTTESLWWVYWAITSAY